MDTALHIWSLIAEYVPLVVTAAAAAAAALPAPTEGTVWSTVRKLIDWAALNVGNAKNTSK